MLIITDCMLVPLQESIDFKKAPALKLHLDEMQRGGVKRIVLDFDQVSYLDSSGLAMLLNKLKDMQRSGGTLSFINVAEPIMNKLRLARLIDLIPVVPKKKKSEIKPLPKSVLPTERYALKIDESSLEGAREDLRSFFTTLPLSSEEVFDLTLIVGEAIGNVILHTPAKIGFVTIEVFPDRMHVEVVDDGPGYEIGENELPIPTLDHGRGIKIMRLLADSVSIAKKPNGIGTVVKIVKLF